MQSLSNLCYRQRTYSTARAERKGSADSISKACRFKGTASAAAIHEKLRCRSSFELTKGCNSFMFLECRDLTFGYQGTTKTLFKNLSFKFQNPGFHSLFGSSGVGKSSLARILCGLLRPEKGRVDTDSIDSLLYAHNLERLPGWSSIGEHIERITPHHNQDKKELLIRHFGMSAHLRKRFSQLSLGQKNRINLLRYLVQDFNVLIVDECLANVDEKLRARILIHIKAMFKDRLFIYISHNVIEVATYCQQIWVLRGPERDEQAVLVRGQDCRDQKCLDRSTLQQTMLEIMNAA